MSSLDSIKVFNPLACLNKEEHAKYAVISHNNVNLEHQTIYDLWLNAAYRASTSSGMEFCNRIRVHQKLFKDLDSEEVRNFAPNILVTPPNKKIKPHFKDRVIYSHSALKGSQALFDELKVCLETVIVEMKGKLESCNGSIVILTDAKCTEMDFVMFSNLLTNPKITNSLGEVKVYLFCCESCTFLVPQGKSLICTKNHTDDVSWCSLVPASEPARVQTAGLRWDLNNNLLKFGELISTSNKVLHNQDVKLVTDQQLIFSMGCKY